MINLNNKTFLIQCDDNFQTQIRFFQDDYKHLTGIYSDLDDAEFYDKCKQGIISTGNIDTLQKYDWSTLKKKTQKIECFHNLLYSKADKSLLLNDLKTNTTTFIEHVVCGMQRILLMQLMKNKLLQFLVRRMGKRSLQRWYIKKKDINSKTKKKM